MGNMIMSPIHRLCALKKDHAKLFKLQDTVFLHIDFWGEKNDFTTLGLLILTS